MRLGADLGWRRLVRAGRGAAARDAAGKDPVGGRWPGGRAVHPRRAPQRAAGLPAAADHLRVLLLRHLRAGRRQPAGLLLRARRRAARARGGCPRCNPRFRTPINALLAGAVVTVLFVLLVFYSPVEGRAARVHHLPGQHQRPRVAGVVRGQRHLPVVPAHRDRGDRRRGRAGWVPEGSFRLGRWGWTVRSSPLLYLGLMLAERRRADRADQRPRATSTSTGSRCW